MPDNPTTEPEPDLIEVCLRTFHGSDPYGWNLLKHQWPETALIEQARKMSEVIKIVRSAKNNA